ncbi:MAG: hypothetical protein WCS56_01750 [Bacilli bacterium]
MKKQIFRINIVSIIIIGMIFLFSFSVTGNNFNGLTMEKSEISEVKAIVPSENKYSIMRLSYIENDIYEGDKVDANGHTIGNNHKAYAYELYNMENAPSDFVLSNPVVAKLCKQENEMDEDFYEISVFGCCNIQINLQVSQYADAVNAEFIQQECKVMAMYDDCTSNNLNLNGVTDLTVNSATTCYIHVYANDDVLIDEINYQFDFTITYVREDNSISNMRYNKGAKAAIWKSDFSPFGENSFQIDCNERVGFLNLGSYSSMTDGSENANEINNKMNNIVQGGPILDSVIYIWDPVLETQVKDVLNSLLTKIKENPSLDNSSSYQLECDVQECEVENGVKCLCFCISLIGFSDPIITMAVGAASILVQELVKEIFSTNSDNNLTSYENYLENISIALTSGRPVKFKNKYIIEERHLAQGYYFEYYLHKAYTTEISDEYYIKDENDIPAYNSEAHALGKTYGITSDEDMNNIISGNFGMLPVLEDINTGLTASDCVIDFSKNVRGIALNTGEYKWYKFTAPKDSVYIFYTYENDQDENGDIINENADTYIELFTDKQPAQSTVGLQKEDDNSGENENAKIYYKMNKDEIIWIRVRGDGWKKTEAFTFEVNDAIINSYDLHERCNYQNIDSFFIGKEVKLYELNVINNTTYKFIVDNQDINVNILNSNFQEINEWDFTTTIENGQTQILGYIDSGIYYLQIINNMDKNILCTSIESTHADYKVPIYLNSPKNCLNYMYQGHNEFVFNNYGAKYILFEIKSFKNGEQIYSDGTIKITDSDDHIINRNMYIGDCREAFTHNNSIIVELLHLQTYYIYIDYDDLDIDTMSITANTINDSFEIDKFDSNCSSVIDNEYLNSDVAKIFDIKQSGKFNLELNISNNIRSDSEILIQKINCNEIILLSDIIGDFSSTTELDFEQGEYNLIFFNMDSSVTVTINRIISKTIDPNLDPDNVLIVGTEITMNNGNYNGYTITQGYTRILYLPNTAEYTSRLDYEWYSSNAEIAEISNYGTILAKNVSEVEGIEIFGVCKQNRSIVVSKIIDVIPEISPNDKITILYDIELIVNESCIINLDSNSPSLILLNYTWVSDDATVATVNAYGEICKKAAGNIGIRGIYKYNPRYLIIYYIHDMNL